MSKASVNSKLFQEIIGRLSVKEQPIRLKDSEERFVEADEKICKELNANIRSIFIMEDTVTLKPM